MYEYLARVLAYLCLLAKGADKRTVQGKLRPLRVMSKLSAIPLECAKYALDQAADPKSSETTGV